MEEMVRAFDLNLTALSLLGLLFGVFLIYNTMTFSVVQRRRLFGTLRALGPPGATSCAGSWWRRSSWGPRAPPWGSSSGSSSGAGSSASSPGPSTTSTSSSRWRGSPSPRSPPPGGAGRGRATLLASLPPAWEATTVSAREALARSTVESRVRALVPRRPALGGALLVGGGRAPPPHRALRLGRLRRALRRPRGAGSRGARRHRPPPGARSTSWPGWGGSWGDGGPGGRDLAFPHGAGAGLPGHCRLGGGGARDHDPVLPRKRGSLARRDAGRPTSTSRPRGGAEPAGGAAPGGAGRGGGGASRGRGGVAPTWGSNS
jgi:hypothetical protein